MSDPRFARLKNDPRFRRPKKYLNKVAVDDRFKAVFHDEEGKKTNKSPRVDKYGRPVSKNRERDDLHRFYRLENQADSKPAHPPDYARGEVLLESSDEENEPEVEESDEEGIVTLGRDASHPIAVPHDGPEAEIDLNEDNFADLDAQAASYAQTCGNDDDGVDVSPTYRIAVVNLDWDHVRAIHLYKICSSVLSALQPGNSQKAHAGQILSVRVYPSEFGRERLAREETEGPPAEIYKQRDTDEFNEKAIHDVGGDADYDEDALRKYQLERLRYYYAIITCDSAETAACLYSELEGTELERSANVFDLSYVPDDMTFDEQCRDEALEDPNTGYKGIDFATDALRHSKVKLTWDEDDPERNQLTRRTFAHGEVEKMDFQAYLASPSSESESNNEDAAVRKSRKDASRDKLRTLLLDGAGEDLPEGWGNAVKDDGKIDMEITFTPGLTGAQGEDRDETTLEKYQRKVKEKRRKRKEEVKQMKSKQKAEEATGRVASDEFFDSGRGEDEEAKSADEYSHQKQRSSGPRHAMSAEELQHLFTSDIAASEPKHFNMKSVVKAEKAKGRRRQKVRQHDNEEGNEIQEDFTIDVKDDRFKAVHEDHSFAIDPSNPHFKRTKSMAALLEERTRRQRDSPHDEADKAGKALSSGKGDKSLETLIESVKRKSAVPQSVGKRQRV